MTPVHARVGSPTVRLVAGRGVLGLEVLAADPQEIGPGLYCLPRIQKDRGGWQPQATLNRSPVCADEGRPARGEHLPDVGHGLLQLNGRA